MKSSDSSSWATQQPRRPYVASQPTSPTSAVGATAADFPSYLPPSRVARHHRPSRPGVSLPYLSPPSPAAPPGAPPSHRRLLLSLRLRSRHHRAATFGATISCAAATESAATHHSSSFSPLPRSHLTAAGHLGAVSTSDSMAKPRIQACWTWANLDGWRWAESPGRTQVQLLSRYRVPLSRSLSSLRWCQCSATTDNRYITISADVEFHHGLVTSPLNMGSMPLITLDMETPLGCGRIRWRLCRWVGHHKTSPTPKRFYQSCHG